MKSNTVTRGLAIGLLVLYFLWSLFSLPFTNILVSASIGLISYGSSESIEIASVSTIVTGVIFYTYIKSWSMEEGFEANKLAVIEPAGPVFDKDGMAPLVRKDSVQAENMDSIVKRIAEISGGSNVIKGMLSADYLEGFADANVVDNPVPDAGSKDADKKKEDAVTNSAVPAEVKDSAKVSETFKNQMPNNQAVETFAKDSAKTGAENTALFRLGSIPTDMAGGPHIDASTTLMGALNALKPDQIKSMTDDTQKLMETQKNLMNMLNSMKPMLQDGKQMMETFGTMFNK